MTSKWKQNIWSKTGMWSIYTIYKVLHRGCFWDASHKLNAAAYSVMGIGLQSEKGTINAWMLPVIFFAAVAIAAPSKGPSACTIIPGPTIVRRTGHRLHVRRLESRWMTGWGKRRDYESYTNPCSYVTSLPNLMLEHLFEMLSRSVAKLCQGTDVKSGGWGVCIGSCPAIGRSGHCRESKNRLWRPGPKWWHQWFLSPALWLKKQQASHQEMSVVPPLEP